MLKLQEQGKSLDNNQNHNHLIKLILSGAHKKPPPQCFKTRSESSATAHWHAICHDIVFLKLRLINFVILFLRQT